MNIWLIKIWDGDDLEKIIPVKDDYTEEEIINFAIEKGYRCEPLNTFWGEAEKICHEAQTSYDLRDEIIIKKCEDDIINIYCFNLTADITIEKEKVLEIEYV